MGNYRDDPVIDPLDRGQRQVDQERIRLGMQMDDRQFQGALVDSQVRIPIRVCLADVLKVCVVSRSCIRKIPANGITKS
jgi:hypothetical protein